MREEKAAAKAAKAADKPKPVPRVLNAEKQVLKDTKEVKAAAEKASAECKDGKGISESQWYYL